MKARFSFFLAVWMILALFGGGMAAEPPANQNSEYKSQNRISITKRMIVNIPASSFRPTNNTYSYENHGRYLIQYNASSDTGDYYAPLNLPQNVVVTKLTFYFRDNTTDNGVMRLMRTRMNGTGIQMAAVDSSGVWASPSYGSKSTDTITDAYIDNDENAYYLNWELPDSTTGTNADRVWGCGVIIEYGITPSLNALPYSYSITGAAFTPYEDGYSYSNGGSVLQYTSGPGGSTNNGWFQGRLHLPDGATVKKMVFYYNLNSNYQGVARLQRTHLGEGNYNEMATVYTGIGAPGATSSYDDTIVNAVIDNIGYSYWVVVDIPALSKGNSNIVVYGVRIEYEPAHSGGDDEAASLSGEAILPESDTAAASDEAKGVISLSAANFVPYEDGYDYQNHARYMFHFSGPGGAATRGWYTAPVQLPDKATITRIMTYWYDNKDNEYGLGLLQRSTMGQGNFIQLASTDTDFEYIDGFLGAYTVLISNPVVDNAHYTYWLTVDLPLSTGSSHPATGDVAFCGATIEYAYLSYLPNIVVDVP